MKNNLLKFNTNFCRMATTTVTRVFNWTLYEMWQRLQTWIGFPTSNVPTSDAPFMCKEKKLQKTEKLIKSLLHTCAACLTTLSWSRPVHIGLWEFLMGKGLQETGALLISSFTVKERELLAKHFHSCHFSFCQHHYKNRLFHLRKCTSYWWSF